MSLIAASGRVTSQVITYVLGWQPGDRLTLTAGAGMVRVHRHGFCTASAGRRCGGAGVPGVPASAMRELANWSRHRRLTSRPLLDDLRVQELPDKLDAETGIGNGVLGAQL